MTDVIFYDFDFNRLRDFAKPISVNIEKCYCGYGTAELHFAINEQSLIKLLDENEYLFFTVGELSAIVTGWRLGEDIAIYARTPEWLLTKRGAETVSFSSSSAEIIAQTIIADIPNFVASGERSNVGEAMDYSTDRVRNLYDVICEILDTQSLGFEVYPDLEAKEFVFRVYEGEQSLCMFSSSNRTADEMQYLVEMQDRVSNSGWYERRYKDKGGWSASANTPSLVNNKASNAYTFYRVTSSGTTTRFGLSCTQNSYLYCDNVSGTWKISAKKPSTIWVYIDNAKKSGIKKWDAVLSGTKTEDEAKAEISQRSIVRDTSCEAYRFEYGKDYHLGDIVRVQYELDGFKKSEEKRVTSVAIYYDTDKSGVRPTLKSLEE